MSKHIFKKFEAQNKNSSTAAIPTKKVKFSDENSYPRTSSVTCASKSTIESRRISLSSSVIEHTTEATQSVFEVVCCSHCKIFEGQLQSIEKNLEKLDHLQMIVDTQNTAIMDAIAGLKVATEQLVRQEVQNTPVVKYFPLCDVYEMQQLDEKITSSNRDVYEAIVTDSKFSGFKTKDNCINSFYFDGYMPSTQRPNNYCSLKSQDYVEIVEFKDQNSNVIKGKKLLNLSSFFTEPIDSLTLGICTADLAPSPIVEEFYLDDVEYKLMCIPLTDKLLLIPILHTCM
ncbi:uncharacterized protein [Eurosta solidaginis]|uniref:uncharacterized protein n=1 Tax=Eurosta solidaginis TaxID=178769 RepID=UPI003531460E